MKLPATSQRKSDGLSSPSSGPSLSIAGARDPWWTALLFAGGYLLFGMLDAWLSFVVDANPPTTIAPGAKLPPIWPPSWVFWAVWIVIYPGKGLAIWSVWRLRKRFDLRWFYGFALLLFLMDMAFLPISALTNNNPAVLSLMDSGGIIFLPLSAWIYGRYTKTALLWLIPIFLWGPFTLFIKVWLWLLNGHTGAI